jgi:lipopolysaccharide export system permease protein
VLLSILHRTILMELVRVFLLALIGLTGILLMGGVVAEATQRGLGPAQILLAIPLLIPSTLPYTLPATTLFATCVVYGRLAHDNEILAIKAAGINLIQVVWPAVFLGLAISAITVGLYLDVIPSTHHMLRTRFLADVEEVLYGMLKREGRIQHPKLDYVIYVNRVQGRKLIDAQFMRRDPGGQGFDFIARAREAELQVHLSKNQVLVHMYHCWITNADRSDQAYVERKTWPVDLPEINAAHKSTSAMTYWELLDRVDQFDKDIHGKETDIALHQAVIALKEAPDHFPEHVKGLQGQRRQLQGERRSVITELHKRPALALGCLCFVLVGCPVGIWFSRSDYLSAFITCFLPIVFLYYPLLLCSINMARSGQVHPGLALWAANGLLTLLALVLFRRLLKN